jgi:hypothetical protein
MFEIAFTWTGKLGEFIGPASAWASDIGQARKFGPGCHWFYSDRVPPRQVKPKPFEVPWSFDNTNILLAGPELRGRGI